MVDGTSDATRTREAFKAAITEVCETFGIEKFHEEQQKAIDLFFDGKDVPVSLPAGYGKSYHISIDSSDPVASLEETVHYFHCITTDSSGENGIEGLGRCMHYSFPIEDEKLLLSSRGLFQLKFAPSSEFFG